MEVLAELWDLVEPRAKLERLGREGAKPRAQVEALRTKAAAPNYARLPEEARAREAARLAGLEEQPAGIERARGRGRRRGSEPSW